jgi:hypothetical protein
VLLRPCYCNLAVSKISSVSGLSWLLLQALTQDRRVRDRHDLGITAFTIMESPDLATRVAVEREPV